MADDLPRFGASDFFLTQTDPAILREQLRDTLSALLGRSVADSDPHMVLASAFLPYLVQGQASADACAKATLRAFAVGADLDRIADSTCVVGYMDRLSPAPAILATYVGMRVTRSSVEAASDCLVRISAEREIDGVVFSGTLEHVHHFALTDGASAVLVLPVYLYAAEDGSAYNGLLDDALAADAAAISVTVELSEAPSTQTGQTYEASQVKPYRCGSTYGGRDSETDESFAERVLWQAKSLRVPGSYEYYRLLLSALRPLASAYVSPTVDDDGRIVMAYADKAAYFAAQRGVELSDRGEAYAGFLRAVQGSLLIEQRAIAYPAKLHTGSIQAVYKLPAGTSDVASARSAVEAAWRAYVADHAWHCGAHIVTTDAIAALKAAGAAQVACTAIYPIPLPSDAIVTGSQFSLEYQGVETATTAPVGGDGEEITP
jgi:hypothetical protein